MGDTTWSSASGFLSTFNTASPVAVIARRMLDQERPNHGTRRSSSQDTGVKEEKVNQGQGGVKKKKERERERERREK